MASIKRIDHVAIAVRDASGVVLQVLQWKGGSDATIEDRIDRINKLQNQPE